jgi:hypothetical protein
MSGEYNTHDRHEKCIQNFSLKPRREEIIRKHKRRWENDIKMNFKEIGYEDVDWVYLAQDRVQWRALWNTVMNHRVP